MNNVTHSQSNTQKMKQYIVDAPEATDGLIPSSGGLRENGRIAVQYKNPREYKEPVYSPVPVQPDQVDLAKEQLQKTAVEFGTEIFWTLNDNLIQPLAMDGLIRLKNHIIGFFDDLTATPRYQKIIDEETHREESSEDKTDNDKIVKFPDERVS